MKILVMGGTGFVGSEILRQLESRPDVTVTCLTRRLFIAKRAHVVLHEDFVTYDESIAEHDACLWTLGGKGATEETTHNYALACARTFATHAAKPVRFCYLSGMGANVEPWLPWERRTRQLKGTAERELEALTKEHPHFRTTAFRPAGIIASRLAATLLAAIAVTVSAVATAMIREATIANAARFRVLHHRAIRAVGI